MISPEQAPPGDGILISVVVPAYNYGHLLGRMLDSVLGQLGERTEMVVVDDGSTDSTPQVLADYQGRQARLRVVRQPNAGAGAARNHGVRLARGKYVLPLDADDELLPDALAALSDRVDRQPGAGMVLGAHVSVFADGKERIRLPRPADGSAASKLRRYLLEKKISISHGCTLFRRDLLLACPYAESLPYSEDVPVFAYVLAHAQVVTLDQPLARIHKHADSLRHRRSIDAGFAETLAAAVFERLPPDCQPLRRPYEAQRYLSQFRMAMRADRCAEARSLYRQAFQRSPLRAMHWRNLGQSCRLLWRSLRLRGSGAK